MDTVTADVARLTFEQDGFVSIGAILTPDEVTRYREIYDLFLSGAVECGDKRSDLGSAEPRKQDVENITQVMWPSVLHPPVLDLPLHERTLRLARLLIGDDAAFDFDMLIDKAPATKTPTPWHQDAAYWIDMPDARAASFWVALDDANVDNGCMWYVRGSHRLPLRPHWTLAQGGAIECECSEDEPGAVAVPLTSGSAAVHAGGTLHYSRGNVTPDRSRRAYILNYRPAEMIRLERERGMDHGLEENVRHAPSSATTRTRG